MGWTTTIDAGTVFGLVYCNVSSANTGGGIVGQTSTGASCSSDVACFFIDELPYVLVRGQRGFESRYDLLSVQ